MDSTNQSGFRYTKKFDIQISIELAEAFFFYIAPPKLDSNAFSDHYVIIVISLHELRSLRLTELII
jgi:hypothetical protein